MQKKPAFFCWPCLYIFSTAPAASNTPIRMNPFTDIPLFTLLFNSLFCDVIVFSIIIPPFKNFYMKVRTHWNAPQAPPCKWRCVPTGTHHKPRPAKQKQPALLKDRLFNLRYHLHWSQRIHSNRNANTFPIINADTRRGYSTLCLSPYPQWSIYQTAFHRFLSKQPDLCTVHILILSPHHWFIGIISCLGISCQGKECAW